MFPIMIGSVRPVTQYDEVLRHLSEAFKKKPAPARLAGLLFARPASGLAKEEVLPHLAYLHQRSGDAVHFYCGGYWEGRQPPDPGTGRVSVGNGWMYADDSFNAFRAQVEARSQWRYSGGVDLILVGARPAPVRLDFSCAVVIDLERLKKDGALPSLSQLFEGICRYAAAPGAGNPAWGLSDGLAGAAAGEALKEAFLAGLPDALRGKARESFHYAARDISRAPRGNALWRWLKRRLGLSA
jgi:hypothetical protein